MDFQGSTHPTTLNNNNDKSLDVVDDCVDVEFLDRRMEGTGWRTLNDDDQIMQ